MTASKARVLRVTGIPREMASAAIDTLLTAHRGVLAIDAVESLLGDVHRDAVHVEVEEAEVERIRAKLSTAFADATVEDVTDMNAAARATSLRVRAGMAAADPPALTLEAPPAKDV